MRKLHLEAWAFILPSLAIYVVFVAYPVIDSLFLGFFEWNGIGPRTFVGLSNYNTIFTDSYYRTMIIRSLKNTLFFFLVDIAVVVLAGTLLAYLLYRRPFGFTFFQVTYFLPATMAVVIVGYIWQLILSPRIGALNTILREVGLASLAHVWLGDPKTALPTIVLVETWRYLGLPLMIFLAAFDTIPQEYVDAAKVDGATDFDIVSKILVPLSLPRYLIVLIMTFVSSFNAFDIIYSMSDIRGSPGFSADVFAATFYRIAFGGAGYGGSVNKVGLGASMVSLVLLCTLGFSFWAVWQQSKMESGAS